MAKENKQCIIDECDGERKSRGLCMAHYAHAKELVIKKEYTWDKLEEIGVSLKPQRGRKKEMFKKALGK